MHEARERGELEAWIVKSTAFVFHGACLAELVWPALGVGGGARRWQRMKKKGPGGEKEEKRKIVVHSHKMLELRSSDQGLVARG